MVINRRSAVGIAAACLTAAAAYTLVLPQLTTPTRGRLTETTEATTKPSTTPTPSAMSQPTAIPVSPARTIAADGNTSAVPSRGMLNRGIYGTGMGYDTKANIPVGPDGQKVAIRFKATTTSTLKSVRFVQRGGTRYSLGTGGTMTISVRADDGAGHPAAVDTLAWTNYTPGNPGGAWEKYDAVTFPSPATLTAGTIYYIVFTNSSTTDYISVNSVYAYAATSPRQPMFSDPEYGLMYTSGAWGALERGYAPVVDLAYANGTHDGQSFYEAMIDRYATISGARKMARERFTVSGGDRTVESASLRLRRSGGTSPLVMTLETSAGVAIESVKVEAARVPVSAPGGDNGGSVWVTGNFSTSHVLSNGVTYNLRMSTASGTTYTTFPVRAGTDKGIDTFAFSGGTGQSTTDGSSWAALYPDGHQNLQFFFTLVPATTSPTTTPAPTTLTTPAPTTTLTTPAPTTTTAPPAASPQCPAVAFPNAWSDRVLGLPMMCQWVADR